MKFTTFEIKIALLGYVSVGKTTVINALLRDKFGEVSMRRTTAGVNYFRLSSKSKKRKASDTKADGDDSMEWTVTPDTVRTANETLHEITADNRVLRSSNKVQTKTFDVELEEDLVEMRKDTKLVICDIPGVNEAGADTKYKDYVSDHWHTFDCVVVVMDAKQGVNTEDQVNLLEFVKECQACKKEVPVIILGNKVDEPEDEEQSLLVAEVRAAVEKIFRVKNTQNALAKVMSAKTSSSAMSKSNLIQFPIFIPISAVHAYIYQTASGMPFDRFKRFDKDLIEKLGREVVGTRKWKRLSSEKKYKEAFEVVSEPSLNKEGLEASNFHKFLAVLDHCIGGAETQQKLLEKQIEVESSRLSCVTGTKIADQLRSLAQKCAAIGLQVEPLRRTFWKLYKECEGNAFAMFDIDPQSVDELCKPWGELEAYHTWVLEMGWNGSKNTTRMDQLVQRMLKTIFKECTEWGSSNLNIEVKDQSWYKSLAKRGKAASVEWSKLTPHDWSNLFESLLVPSSSFHFVESFGREKVFLEQLKTEVATTRTISRYNKNCSTCSQAYKSKAGSGCYNCRKIFLSLATNRTSVECPRCSSQHYGNRKLDETGVCKSCRYSYEMVIVEPGLYSLTSMLDYESGEFKPKPTETQAYNLLVNVDVPTSIKDPNHYGHLVWKYCKFMERLQSAN